MELVAQDFHHLYVVREGRGFRIETERERLPVRENQLVYVPAHVARERPVDDHDDPLTVVILCFYESVFGERTAAVEGFRLFDSNFPALTPFKVGDNYTRLEVRRRLRAIFVEQMRPREASDAVILARLIELLVFFSRTYTEHQPLSPNDPGAAAFAGRLRYLDENFDRPVKIEECPTSLTCPPQLHRAVQTAPGRPSRSTSPSAASSTPSGLCLRPTTSSSPRPRPDSAI